MTGVQTCALPICSQALGIEAAQAGFVELTFPEAGHYTVVDHAFLDAERGALGTVEVTE